MTNRHADGKRLSRTDRRLDHQRAGGSHHSAAPWRDSSPRRPMRTLSALPAGIARGPSPEQFSFLGNSRPGFWKILPIETLYGTRLFGISATRIGCSGLSSSARALRPDGRAAIGSVRHSELRRRAQQDRGEQKKDRRVSYAGRSSSDMIFGKNRIDGGCARDARECRTRARTRIYSGPACKAQMLYQSRRERAHRGRHRDLWRSRELPNPARYR